MNAKVYLFNWLPRIICAIALLLVLENFLNPQFLQKIYYGIEHVILLFLSVWLSVKVTSLQTSMAKKVIIYLLSILIVLATYFSFKILNAGIWLTKHESRLENVQLELDPWLPGITHQGKFNKKLN